MNDLFMIHIIIGSQLCQTGVSGPSGPGNLNPKY